MSGNISKHDAEGAGHPTAATKPTILCAEVDPALHRRFKALCNLNGWSMRERVGQLLTNDVNAATAAGSATLGGLSVYGSETPQATSAT